MVSQGRVRMMKIESTKGAWRSFGFDWSDMAREELQATWLSLAFSNSRNTEDSLKQQQKTDSKTSSVKSPLKVDKDWKEKFLCPANHVREEEPKKARENNDAPIIEDWVSDDEDDDEPNPKVEKKTVIPTAY
ncbi:hypothetical protein Tco_0352683 [Tanacetum coccineum]